MATYIFGHTTPDTDSIVGAISLTYLKNKLGEDCIAARQGEPNPETQWILERFGFDAPLLKTEYAGEDVYLALGQTDSGRYLAVFYILKKNRNVLPISARDMDDKERRRYERKG